MATQRILPFGLTSENLAQVKIIYASYSAKTGVGKSEINISGTGQVKLIEEAMVNDPNPQVHDGNITLQEVEQILDHMEKEGFMDLDDLYAHVGTPIGIRVIELQLVDTGKKVILDLPATCIPFEHIASTIKRAIESILPDTFRVRFIHRF
jgi:hypothetical protein